LLLDLNLPKKSGLEVLKWIRNEPLVSTLPVIVLTSSLQDADIHRAYVQGANAYLVKPAKPDELVAMAKTIKDFWLSQNRTVEKAWDLFGTNDPLGN
jgi:DNA-binding response OmpR family regulator